MASSIELRKGGVRLYLSSRNSAPVRRLRELQTPEGRTQTGMCMIDGIKHLFEAVHAGVQIETLIVSPAILGSMAGRKLAQRIGDHGAPTYILTPDVYHSLSQAEEPQGLAAVVAQRWERLDAVRPSRGLCWVALEGVLSPGNLGTIVRTSEAVGGAGIILIGETADPYDPSCIRATMGTLFRQSFVRCSPADFAAWRRRRQFSLVGTSPHAAEDYHTAAYGKPRMLLMGGERRGLSSEMSALCDVQVRIPMVGRTDSLNVAVATAVMLYELHNRARSQAGI
jgi:TrmH family RNA methyltransferase